MGGRWGIREISRKDPRLGLYPEEVVSVVRCMRTLGKVATTTHWPYHSVRFTEESESCEVEVYLGRVYLGHDSCAILCQGEGGACE
jgi:hypothetical protein